MYLANTALEVGAIAATDLVNNYFNKNPSSFSKDISKDTPKMDLLKMSSKELLNLTKWDFMIVLCLNFHKKV